MDKEKIQHYCIGKVCHITHLLNEIWEVVNQWTEDPLQQKKL